MATSTQPTQCCGVCKLDLQASEFNLNKSRKSGLDRVCRACRSRDYQKNKESVLQKRRAYYESNKEKVRAKSKAWREGNREQYLQMLKDWRERNLELKREMDRRYYAQNRCKAKDYNRQRYEKLRDEFIARAGFARAERDLRMPPCLREEDLKAIRAIYRKAAILTNNSGEMHHVDHIVPLRGESVSGLHVPWNLRILPAGENLSKGNRISETLLQELESWRPTPGPQDEATRTSGHGLCKGSHPPS